MERKKQIEEMARELNTATFGVNVHTLADHLKPETINKVAEYLYNAGYRKQSEGEWLPSPDGINPIRCKNCNAPALRTFEDEFGDTGFYHHPSHFCPNCGAKMRGGTE